jgi:hypothetical protein
MPAVSLSRVVTRGRTDKRVCRAAAARFERGYATQCTLVLAAGPLVARYCTVRDIPDTKVLVGTLEHLFAIFGRCPHSVPVKGLVRREEVVRYRFRGVH